MALKVKFRTLFPALVNVLSPLTVVKTGLRYVFGLDMTALRALLDPFYVKSQAPYFILATGQSNTTRELTLSNAPNVLVTRWNNPLNTLLAGSAFVPLSSTTINVIDKFASDLAGKMPGRPIYILNVSISAQPIASWLPGATPIDMYSLIQANITGALAAAGVTKIDAFLWWQGESDTSNVSYVANFSTLMTRFWSNVWFPRETPVLIFGIAPTSISGDSGTDLVNLRLISSTGADPDKRRFVYTGSLSAPAYWADTLHMTAAGYFAAGAMAADVFLNGAGRNSVANAFTNPVTGFQAIGRFGPIKSSATLAVATVDPSVINLPESFVSGITPIVQFASFDTVPCIQHIDTFAASSGLVGRRANGTIASPSALAADDVITGVYAQGHDGVGYVTNNKAAFEFKTTQNWTASLHGTYASLDLTNGSNVFANAFRFYSGAIQINGSLSGSLTIGPPPDAGSSNQIILPAGSTDFSATGGTGRFVKQASAGAPFTVAAPIVSELGGLGSGIATALAVNTGSAGAPVLFNGNGGTPSAIVLTNATGTATGLTAGLAVAAWTANAAPISGLTGAGTGVLTALAVNVGSAGAPVLFNGAGGTPSSITLTSGTGLPLTTGVTGTLPVANGGTGITAIGAGIATFWGTPSSANLAAALTDEVSSTAASPKALFGTAGSLPATATNDSATAGSLGECVSSSSGAIPLTTATVANIHSISLTAGDWDVTGVALFETAATTNITLLIGSISTTSATLGASLTNRVCHIFGAGYVPGNAQSYEFPLPTVRISLSGTTTVRVVSYAAFTVSTLNAYGSLIARRVR